MAQSLLNAELQVVWLVDTQSDKGPRAINLGFMKLVFQFQSALPGTLISVVTARVSLLHGID